MRTFLRNLLSVNVQLLIGHESLLYAQDTFREVLTSLTVVGHKLVSNYVLGRTAVVEILHRVIGKDGCMSGLANNSIVFLD